MFSPTQVVRSRRGGLEVSAEEVMEMERSHILYRYGSGIYIGMHLAKLEIEIVVAALVGKFELPVDQDCTDESMEMFDTLTAVPRAMRCELVVKKDLRLR